MAPPPGSKRDNAPQSHDQDDGDQNPAGSTALPIHKFNIAPTTLLPQAATEQENDSGCGERIRKSTRDICELLIGSPHQEFLDVRTPAFPGVGQRSPPGSVAEMDVRASLDQKFDNPAVPFC